VKINGRLLTNQGGRAPASSEGWNKRIAVLLSTAGGFVAFRLSSDEKGESDRAIMPATYKE